MAYPHLAHDRHAVANRPRSPASRSRSRGGRGTSSAMHTMAQGLGWFSIGLGLAEMLAPRSLARSLGMERHENLVRAYGLREIATGFGILTAKDPTPWIWARVGGDALDLATLATGLEGRNPRDMNVGFAMAAVAGVTALDVVCARGLSGSKGASPEQRHDYRTRSGFPRPPEAMRGMARDAEIPADMRTPEALRPYTQT